MDDSRKRLPGAEALGNFDVSDLRGREPAESLRSLIPQALAGDDLIPQAPPPGPPAWWKNPMKPVDGAPQVAPTPQQELTAQRWLRDNFPPSTLQWWYRENSTLVPNTAATILTVGQEYRVPSGQALAIMNVIPVLFTTNATGQGTETDAFATAFVANFRMTIAGRSALDSEHIAPAFGGSTINRWDTGLFNRSMYWGGQSPPVPYSLYVREGELLKFELLPSTTLAAIYTALATPTAIVCGYRAMGALFPMTYLP